LVVKALGLEVAELLLADGVYRAATAIEATPQPAAMGFEFTVAALRVFTVEDCCAPAAEGGCMGIDKRAPVVGVNQVPVLQ
jgi:hypothetical protein